MWSSKGITKVKNRSRGGPRGRKVPPWIISDTATGGIVDTGAPEKGKKE